MPVSILTDLTGIVVAKFAELSKGFEIEVMHSDLGLSIQEEGKNIVPYIGKSPPKSLPLYTQTHTKIKNLPKPQSSGQINLQTRPFMVGVLPSICRTHLLHGRSRCHLPQELKDCLCRWFVGGETYHWCSHLGKGWTGEAESDYFAWKCACQGVDFFEGKKH